jgi:hypothetical protein
MNYCLHGGFVMMRAIGMDYEISKIPTFALTPPFTEWCQHYAHVITSVEFTPSADGNNKCEPGRTSHDSEHRLLD